MLNLTGVLLRGHLGAHDIAEVLKPVLLVALRLTGKQETAVRCFYGDAMLPSTITIGASRQAGGDTVAVIFVPQEHLTLCKGILENTDKLLFLAG